MSFRHSNLAGSVPDFVLAGVWGCLARFECRLAHDITFPPMAKTGWHFRRRCDFMLTSDQTTANIKLLPRDGFRQLLDPGRMIPSGAPTCG